jgi:hypothetical protein
MFQLKLFTFGKRLHITEKTFKAIALEMPFVLVAPVGSLEYMRRIRI